MREIRVNPVVRYVVTDWLEGRGARDVGEFASAELANQYAADRCFALRVRDAQSGVSLDPARQLRIDTIRAPGSPKPPTRWELREVARA